MLGRRGKRIMDNQTQQQQIPLQAAPEILKGVYTNNMQVAHTREEFILDFMNISYTPQVVNLVAKIITNPGHFKRMVVALQDNIKKYEEQFGKIEGGNPQAPVTPSSTSDRPFGFGSK